jgi:hypothetical protein
MIPYLLTAVGGYLIGSSLSTKFANGGDIEEYKKWESRYDMLGELYEDANAEERKNIQKEMDELESKMHKSERNYANGGRTAFRTTFNPTKKEINDTIKKLMDVVSQKKDYQTQLMLDEISDYEKEIIEYTHLPQVMQDEDYLNNMLINQLRRYLLSNGKPFELNEKKYNFIQEQGLFENGGDVEMDEFEFERKETEKEFANGGDIESDKVISLYESFYENGKEYMRLLAQGIFTKEREEKFKKRAKEAMDKKFDEGRYDYKQEVYVHNKNVRKPYLQKYQVFANGGEIANTILSQLGGARRLNIMTGAYNFVDLGSGLSFKLKNQRANYVKIKLNSMDLYDIEVGRIRGTTYKVIDSANNMYFDQLKPFIEKATGLYLSLKEGGEVNEKYQIKRSDGKYLSIGMDGKTKWNESPDLGYIYKKEDAETFSEYLNQKGEEVEVTKYDKDWWKK